MEFATNLLSIVNLYQPCFPMKWHFLFILVSCYNDLFCPKAFVFFFKYTHLLTYLKQHLVILAGNLSKLITIIGIVYLLLYVKITKGKHCKKYHHYVYQYIWYLCTPYHSYASIHSSFLSSIKSYIVDYLFKSIIK